MIVTAFPMSTQPDTPTLKQLEFKRQAQLSMRAQTIYLVLCSVARQNGETEPLSMARKSELRRLAEQAVMAVDGAVVMTAEARARQALRDQALLAAQIVKDNWQHATPAVRYTVENGANEVVEVLTRPAGSGLWTATASVLSAYHHGLLLPTDGGR